VNIKTIDNFLSKSYFDTLQNMVTSQMFPWSYMGDITSGSNSKIGSFGFNYTLGDHNNFRDSSETQFSMPCLYIIKDAIGASDLWKGRYDMTLYNPDNHIHDRHIDSDELPNYRSTILYMNDSDGDTILYKEKAHHQRDVTQWMKYTEVERITPKANRLLIFDGDIIHTGHSPSKNKTRILLNAVFQV